MPTSVGTSTVSVSTLASLVAPGVARAHHRPKGNPLDSPVVRGILASAPPGRPQTVPPGALFLEAAYTTAPRRERKPINGRGSCAVVTLALEGEACNADRGPARRGLSPSLLIVILLVIPLWQFSVLYRARPGSLAGSGVESAWGRRRIRIRTRIRIKIRIRTTRDDLATEGTIGTIGLVSPPTKPPCATGVSSVPGRPYRPATTPVRACGRRDPRDRVPGESGRRRLRRPCCRGRVDESVPASGMPPRDPRAAPSTQPAAGRRVSSR